MARKRNRARVPGVLWRLYRDRARTLSDAITSLLPPPPVLCRCNGRRCLGCAADANSFLLRPGDPSDYRKLLAKCYVVVSENAPSVPFFVPPSGLPQDQIVKRTIERMLYRREPSNVLSYGYDRRKCSSPTVELLSCASWCLLLSRVGDDFMVYLLRNTSIFLPVPHGKHHQVGGPLISRVCFDKLKCQPKFHYQNDSQKRKRADADDLTVEKLKCHISHSTNGSLGFSSNVGLTDKSSMQLTRHHGSRNYDVSVFEVPKSTRTGTVTSKLESEVKQGLNCITPRLGKRSRPFSWQRRSSKLQKHLTFEENSLNTHCNIPATDTDCLHASFQPNTTSLSYQKKSLCPEIFVVGDIIHFLHKLCSDILYSLKKNLACSKHLIGEIFGFSYVNAGAQPMLCLHNNDSYLIDSGCLYHALVKWFKHLIRRTRCCQHTKLLDKHCVLPSLDKHTIGGSSSRLKDNVSETKEHKKSWEYGTKHFVSFIWAVSRSLLPPELLGTPPAWRIMRRNISKFIHLRRFEKFPLKLCMHELKISLFPFLSNEYFLNSQNACVPKYPEGKNKLFHQEFKNWNDSVHGIKRKLLEKWIFWYYSCLVVPLVQASFYVTESEQGKQDIYYYPKPVWEKLSGSTIACFKDWRCSNLDDMAVRNILRGRSFGFSKLRLQPKENGVRMFEHYQSVNSVLRDAHTIIKGILFKEPDKLGSSVFDYNDVYKKLCPFLVGRKKGSTSMPSLFIVTSDVLKAFDYIDQDKLLGIMNDVLLKDEYSLKQYDQVVCTKKSLWVQKQFTMLDETSNNVHTRFTSFASFRSRHSVFVNQVSFYIGESHQVVYIVHSFTICSDSFWVITSLYFQSHALLRQ
uniref:Telomerase reverse transcriptase n=1 Tax=Cajanus cajan TaxID=3821 RepID=A0A151S207_CAJCA|nr:Telomerase reverse transcriptase [Cajanus cajan]